MTYFQAFVVSYHMQAVELSLVKLLKKALGRGKCYWSQMVDLDVVDLLLVLIGLLLQPTVWLWDIIMGDVSLLCK